MQLPSKLLCLICLLAVSIEATETQEFFFNLGFTAPYTQEYVNEVLHKPVDVTSKTLLDLSFVDTQLVTPTRFNFYLIQSLDMYSTYRGLKYSCITEANPFVFGGSKPSALELVLFKAVIIGMMRSIYGHDLEEWEYFQTAANYTTGYAVVNNFSIIKKAKDICPK